MQSYAQCLHGKCQCIPGANQRDGHCLPGAQNFDEPLYTILFSLNEIRTAVFRADNHLVRMGNFCISVNQCPLGEAAKDGNGKMRKCKSDGKHDCPTDYYCLYPEYAETLGFCCPKISKSGGEYCKVSRITPSFGEEKIE